VKLGGYAAIPSALIDMRRTSPTLTLFSFFFFGLLHFQRLILVPSIYKQVALAHLESIIYDPHHSDSSLDEPSVVNGTDEEVSGGGDTVANGDTRG
jgi:hypothetical protein